MLDIYFGAKIRIHNYNSTILVPIKVQFFQEIGVCLRLLQQIEISVRSNREQATAAQQRGLVIRGKFLRFV